MTSKTEGFGLCLSKIERDRLWSQLADSIEGYLGRVDSLAVPQRATREAVRELLDGEDFARARDPSEVVRWAAKALEDFQLHTSHPAYYGVFNPQPSTMSVAAEALAAAFNPQLASSASSLFCIEVEDRLVDFFADAFGFETDRREGIFTSGGTEANHTSLLAALNRALPEWRERGLSASPKPLCLYATEEAHHSILRSARAVGLGTDSVRILPVDAELRLDLGAFRAQLGRDQEAGYKPFYVVGTLGSTSAGVVDPLEGLAQVAGEENLWFHVDAAWGGAACLLPEFEALVRGVERADSVTLDPHKWLSISMGCGVYLSRHPGSLRETFGLEPSVYMPDETYGRPTTEPYRQSMQWSRRFLGLRLWMTLMVHGLEGYREVLRHQVRMGEELRRKLEASAWELVNSTPLPVVCFRPPGVRARSEEASVLSEIMARVHATGRTWLTNTRLRFQDQPVLRAGISNFATQPEHLDVLVECLNQARQEVLGG